MMQSADGVLDGSGHRPVDGHLLSEVLARFGCRKKGAKRLDSFVSSVYSCWRGRERVVLKITPGSFRTRDAIVAELDFVAHLDRNGIPTLRSIQSLGGQRVETLCLADQDYLAYGFQWIDGESVDGEEWTADFFRRAGETMGRIHFASKLYPEARKPCRRPAWDEEDHFEQHIRHFPPALSRLGDDARALLRRLRQLPTDRDCYGLLHGDMNTGNLLCGDKMWVIDFENCYYGWFVDDIAASLYYTAHDRWYYFDAETYPHWAASRGLGTDGASFAAYYLEHFLQGYVTICPLAREWIERIPDFLHLRHLDEYLAKLEGWPPQCDIHGRPASLESYVRELEAGTYI
jgi:Ser/Thr protein kinase RdoA (MazF antagonist)